MESTIYAFRSSIKMTLPGCMVDSKEKKSLECAELYTQRAHSDCVGMWSESLRCATDLQSQIPQQTSLLICYSNNRQLHRHLDSCCLSWNCCLGILWKCHKQPTTLKKRQKNVDVLKMRLFRTNFRLSYITHSLNSY